MIDNTYISEAFKKLQLLDEDVFNLGDDEDIDAMKDFVDDDENMEDIEDVIDPEAETEEDLKDSYIGKIIIDCEVCHSKIYKDVDEIVTTDAKNEEGEDIVNVGDECPYCTSTDGYTVIGQIAPWKPGDEVEVTVTPREDVEDNDDEDADVEDDEIELETSEEPEDIEEQDDEEKNESLDEALEDVEVTTETDVIKITSQKRDDAETGEEMFAPLSNENAAAINPDMDLDAEPFEDDSYGLDDFDLEGDNEEQPEEEFEEPSEEPEDDEDKKDKEEDEEVDVDLESFDESYFNNAVESYFKRNYSNVNSFMTESVKTKGNFLVVEGIIGFNSGSNKKTTFMFESKDITNNGKMRFSGANKEISRGKKSFTLSGHMDNGNFITESFNYNYRAKDSKGNSQRVYGTIKVNESLIKNNK